MSDDHETLVLLVATELCKLYGDETLPCDCQEQGRRICHFACDFMDDAERILAIVEARNSRNLEAKS
jgi:hypothetical protein